MGLFFASIKFLPVGSAVSIRYVSPIFASFFAVFLLNERIKFYQWICFFIAFFGVSSLMGLVEMGRKEMMIRMLQVGVVLTFATADGWIMYNDFFIEHFFYFF